MKLNELFEIYLDDLDLTHQDTTRIQSDMCIILVLGKSSETKKLNRLKLRILKNIRKI